MENANHSSIYQLNEDYYNEPEYKINELIEEARILLEKKEFKTAEFYLNLARLEPKIDFNNKIRCYGMTSLIRQSFNDETNLMEYILKILKLLKERPIKIMDVPSAYFIIRILYRTGIIMHLNENYLMSVFLLKFSKNLIIEKGLEGEEKNKESLDKLIQENIDKIRFMIDQKKELFTKKDENLIDKLTKIKKIFCDIERNSTFITKSESEINLKKITENEWENIYLISCTWCNKALAFIEEFTNKYSMRCTSDLFDINKFITKFSIFENESRKINNTFGIYPGPINNFCLLKGKDHWFDDNNDNENYTNLHISTSIKENQDFYLLKQDQWNLVNDVFGNMYEIKRYYFPSRKFHEIFLKEIKIIIINEALKKKDISQIKPKSILVSKFETVAELKAKILKFFLYSLTRNSTNDDNLLPIAKNKSIKLFRAIDYKNKMKRSSIKLIYLYILNNKKFRIPGYLISEENLKIEEINFDTERDVIIADLDANFIEIDEDLIESSDKISCLTCNKLVEKEKLICCNHCRNFQYCSDSCCEADRPHTNFHTIIKKYTFPKLDLKELLKIKLGDIVNRNTCFGRVGLKNLGNTCFMNSAIHCLSHCEDLTKYFILKHHLKDINSQNKYGSSGQVASAYYELILNLWNGKSPYLSPGDFRQILVKIIKKFQGFSQQDSHELLTYLLDTLHEDLNRVADKPYIEMKEKFESESDLEGSKRWWDNHLKRENSIIVDLFHGQYKSTIRCPECQKISITYDPFMYLGLPISSNQNKVVIKYFPNFFRDLKHEYIDIEVAINSNNLSFFTVKDLKLEINQKYGIRKNNKILIQYPMLLLCYEAALLEKDKTFKKILKDETEIFDFIKEGLEVVIYEKFYDLEQIKYKNNYSTFFFNPIFVNQKTSMFIFTNITKINLYYPVLVTISTDSLLFDLYYLLFLIYRKIIPEKEIELEPLKNEDYKISPDKPEEIEEIGIKVQEESIKNNNEIESNKDFVYSSNEFKTKISKTKFKTEVNKFMKIFLSRSDDESYLINEFKIYFSLKENFEFDSNDIPFELYFLNNIPEPTGYPFALFNQKLACEFCGVKNCKFCVVSSTLKMNEKLSKINEKIKFPRQICFLIGFKNVLNTKLYNNDNFPFEEDFSKLKENYDHNFLEELDVNSKYKYKCDSKNDLLNNLSKNVSIYDCLNLFNKEEKLEKDNMWYCSNCKKHQEASKRMEIYKPPHILIIQLKRFKLKSQNSFVDKLINGKNETLVEYPLEGLDIRNYIVGKNSENAVYDLFGISQHFGNLSSGHYTSLCKNKGKWIEFDDETINQADEKDVVNNSAYLLFYRIKNSC